jgi:hypothetical protein
MSVLEVKEKLHAYIDQADEWALMEMWQSVSPDFDKDSPDVLWENPAFIADMEQRIKDLEEGTVQGISVEEAVNNARKAIAGRHLDNE